MAAGSLALLAVCSIIKFESTSGTQDYSSFVYFGLSIISAFGAYKIVTKPDEINSFENIPATP